MNSQQSGHYYPITNDRLINWPNFMDLLRMYFDQQGFIVKRRKFESTFLMNFSYQRENTWAWHVF